jgi:hypothetical protein
VAEAVAAAIAAEPVLSASGVTAFADGNRVVTTGTIESVSISDPGLRTAPIAVPALSSLALLLLACLTVVVATLGVRRSRRLAGIG